MDKKDDEQPGADDSQNLADKNDGSNRAGAGEPLDCARSNNLSSLADDTTLAGGRSEANYESGDDNNESVEDNNDGERDSNQMNISNEEIQAFNSKSPDDCFTAQHNICESCEEKCQSVIYSNFDESGGDEFEGQGSAYKTNLDKLNAYPNLVLTVDDDTDVNCDEDITLNTNMTKVSDSTNQQDEDYIDEDFAPNQLNISSSDEGGEDFENASLNEDELNRLKHNSSKSSSNTDNVGASPINNFADEPNRSRLDNTEFKVNDLTTVNDFNGTPGPSGADGVNVLSKILFQDNDFEPQSNANLFFDMSKLKITENDKPFVKNIDDHADKKSSPSSQPCSSFQSQLQDTQDLSSPPTNTINSSSSLKFESVSSIEDNSNEFVASSNSSSNIKSQVSAVVESQQASNSFSDSSASLTVESISNAKMTSSELFQPFNYQIDASPNEASNENEAHIWTETEALLLQHEQTAPSACGASAVINVLKALNHPFDLDSLSSKVKINSRIPESMASTTTLAQYLFSRSVAGMNAQELIQNIENVTDSQITGRFFPFYPPREVNLPQWLAYWIRKGAVPVALLNLQKISIWGFIPDAWHHQMIYACDSDGVYLTNPIERVSIETLIIELTSESILLVRSQDVIKRFKANNANLMELLTMKGKSNREKRRWLEMNVLGQVLNVLRENKAASATCDNSDDNFSDLESTHQDASALLPSGSHEDINRIDLNSISHHGANPVNAQFGAETNGFSVPVSNLGSTSSSGGSSSSSSMTTHIAIPASYVPGITLFAYRGSPLFNEILSADDLSLKRT